MKLKPHLTEKSLEEAKKGNYTFLVDPSLTKGKIRELIAKIYKVGVAKVRTANLQGVTRKDFRGRKREIMPRKKAVVTLQGKDKIDLFEIKSK